MLILMLMIIIILYNILVTQIKNHRSWYIKNYEYVLVHIFNQYKILLDNFDII